MADRRKTDAKAEKRLPRHHFKTAVRFLSSAAIGQVHEFKAVTYGELKRLGVKRDLDAAAPFNVKAGSAQVDAGSLYAWMRAITPKDKKAVRQLQALDATACNRG